MRELNELDEAVRHAHNALYFLRKQYEQAAKPFLDRLATIENIRPRSYVVDGKTFMPIDLPKPERPSPPPTDDIVAGLRLVSNELGVQRRYALRKRVDRAIAALGEKGCTRETVIRECWDAINSWIKTGPLPTTYETERRNGMVLATNVLMGMMVGEGAPPVAGGK